MTPEFVEKFDLDADGDPDNYRDFIVRLRQRVTQGIEAVHIQQQGTDEVLTIKVLPDPPNAAVPRVFDVELHTGRGAQDQALTLRIQMHDLYILGYRAGQGSWHEFANGRKKPLIPGAKLLQEKGNYDKLEANAKVENGRAGIPLGLRPLQHAIHELFRIENSSEATAIQARAHSLIVIIQMISESMRIYPMLEHIHAHWYDASAPPANVLDLETEWGTDSGRIRDYARDPTASPRPNTEGQHSSIEFLIVSFALLLSRHHYHGGSGPRLLQAVDMETTASQALIAPDGRPLAEVFSVCILKIDNENEGDLYGTITATDCLQSYFIYKRDKENSEPISVRDYATLTGPSRALSAADNFIIDVNLKDHDYISFDDEVSRGQIEWNAYDYTNVYDEIQTLEINGEYGSTQLRYAVMSNAAEALVDVVLINGDDENPAGVYGKVYAMNTSFNDEIELFRKSDGNPEQVYPKASIPLLRPAVVVPMDASLKIRVDLWDYDKLSPDDKIARGTVEFKPEIYHSVHKSIKGDYGEVDVRVTWK